MRQVKLNRDIHITELQQDTTGPFQLYKVQSWDISPDDHSLIKPAHAFCQSPGSDPVGDLSAKAFLIFHSFYIVVIPILHWRPISG